MDSASGTLMELAPDYCAALHSQMCLQEHRDRCSVVLMTETNTTTDVQTS